MKHIILSLCSLAALSTQALDLSLQQCVDMAVKVSEEVRIADNAVTQAGMQRAIARTAYMPSFSGNATGMYRTPDTDYMGMSLRMRSVYMAGINLQQPIYAGGKIVAANRLSTIGQTAAREQYRMTVMDVKANAETSYWTYVAILAKVKMMESYMALIDTAYNQTQASLRAGMVTSNDLLRIEARRSQVVYQLQQVNSGADLCRLSLCTMLHLDEDTPITPTDSDITVTSSLDLEAYDLSSRPEIVLLNQEILAKEQQVKITRADFLPTLGMQAGWSAYGGIKTVGSVQGEDGNYYPFSSETKGQGWSIMLSLNVPLWHWGEGIKKVKHARLDVENARLQLEHNSRMMQLQVRQAIENVTTSNKLLESANVALKQATMNLDNMTQSYTLGMATLTDYLDAQSQWHTSYSNLIEARTQHRIYLVDYLRATARL